MDLASPCASPPAEDRGRRLDARSCRPGKTFPHSFSSRIEGVLMFLSHWLRQFAQRWSLRGTRRRRARRVPTLTRRPIRLRLEVLEERLTPSSDVLVFTTPSQMLVPGQPSAPITVQLQDGNGNPVAATSKISISLASSSNGGLFLNTSGNPLLSVSIP